MPFKAGEPKASIAELFPKGAGAKPKGGDTPPSGAKAQRMRGGIVEIVRKVFAIDGMPLVFTIVYTGAL